MNRVLYQLSYAAIQFADEKISFVIISICLRFVKQNIRIFPMFFGYSMKEVKHFENLEKFNAVFVGWRRIYGN